MEETNAFGLAGGPRRVDERRELLALDAGDDIVDRARILREVGGTGGFEISEGQDPVLVLGIDGAVDEDRLLELGNLAAVLAQLAELTAILDEREARVRVGQDVCGFLGRARRIDGRGRAARRQNAEVAEQPLEPRVAEDADALLALDAEGE